ncbi:hypothetical protein [Allostreptomyces psammosilenae]|uniref:DNA-3-methyladenine glycosylase II n=1 Tax=Allostreptomyces psammosilenae TaxID=1892865 RepID=A0A853A4I8_9ACTN|nr:hypothetical protein [Allostreptomyces psammosilenae]NYI07794.1 DNA-3-methyladenine glycosylase II [Allostreptomyces psammosilenae]
MRTTLITDHPGWETSSDGTSVRLMAAGESLWLATHDEGALDLECVAGPEDRKIDTHFTVAAALPPRAPAELMAGLAPLGSVLRVPNPSLWDAVTTAILRQVVRAAQARALYRRWCAAHGRRPAGRGGGPAAAPRPEVVAALADEEFAAVGAAFHRTALRAAAAAHLERAATWRRMTAPELALALQDIPRVGPWTAAAAAADYTGDFSVYPHHDLAVRTWARRIAPHLDWPDSDRAFAATWRSWTDDDRQLHALTLFTLAWGNHAPTQRRHHGGAPVPD